MTFFNSKKNFQFYYKGDCPNLRLKEVKNASFTSTFDASKVLCLHQLIKNIHIKVTKKFY